MTLASAGWGPASGGAKAGSTNTALAYDALMLRHQVRESLVELRNSSTVIMAVSFLARECTFPPFSRISGNGI